MTEHGRIVIPGLPHHIVQRGVRRRQVFFNDDDRAEYLGMLGHRAKTLGIEILGYCLMPNHVHHEMVPPAKDSFEELFRSVHQRYAIRINQREGCSGHLWQARFFSSPLDENYMWTALRYIDNNPLSLSGIHKPTDFFWSSARGHCGLTVDPLLTRNPKWEALWSQGRDWEEWLGHGFYNGDSEKTLRARTGRNFPCGNSEFIDSISESLGIKLTLRKRGRPPKQPRLLESPGFPAAEITTDRIISK